MIVWPPEKEGILWSISKYEAEMLNCWGCARSHQNMLALNTLDRMKVAIQERSSSGAETVASKRPITICEETRFQSELFARVSGDWQITTP